jgi:two-component system chemotaxis sensor kinase CheA
LSASAEFLAEAQELLESYSQQLLGLEAQLRGTGELDPDLLNAAFRALHTLKGLAGMIGHHPLERFSHELESTLDRMRLGKLTLDMRALDLLFESVELCETLLPDTDADVPATGPFLRRLGGLSQASVEPDPSPLPTRIPGIDDSILGVLSEFEEHRLRENISLGRRIFRISVGFDLLEITTGIDALKAKLKQHGEVISFLPSADNSSDDRINLDVLVASKSTMAELAASIDEQGVGIEVLGTDERMVIGKPAAPPPSAPTPPPTGPSTGQSTGQSTGAIDGDPSVDLTGRQTVRVDLRKLDLLMNLVGELALVHTNLDASIVRRVRAEPMNEYNRAFQDQLRIMSRRLGLLQQGILEVRMVAIGGLCKTLALSVRNDAHKLGKEVRFVVSGADTELDKLLIEKLKNPLMHMVRNAILHGIEMPEVRLAAGKPGAGQIEFAAYQKGNRVVLELNDDGAGIDWRRVRDKAIERGFLSQHEAQTITPAQAINLIFKPGFSTAETVNDLGGRGVGMDVVKTDIAALSGMVDVSSEPGRGSRFRITLPITLAIIQALVLDVAGQIFCIPLNSVIESIMVRREELQTIGGHEVVSVRGRTLPLISLAEVFELERDASVELDNRLYVVIVGLAQHRVGLVVDELLGEQDVVIKPIGTTLGRIPGIAGATELGNNRTVLVLDVASLVSESIGEVNALAGA